MDVIGAIASVATHLIEAFRTIHLRDCKMVMTITVAQRIDSWVCIYSRNVFGQIWSCLHLFSQLHFCCGASNVFSDFLLFFWKVLVHGHSWTTRFFGSNYLSVYRIAHTWVDHHLFGASFQFKIWKRRFADIKRTMILLSYHTRLRNRLIPIICPLIFSLINRRFEILPNNFHLIVRDLLSHLSNLRLRKLRFKTFLILSEIYYHCF